MALPDFIGLLPTDFSYSGVNAVAVGILSGATNVYINTGMFLTGSSSGTNTYTLDVSSQSYSSGWCGFVLRYGVAANAQDFFFLSGATTDLIKLRVENTDEQVGFYYWDGSAWTQIGSTAATDFKVGNRIDINWNLADSGGTIAWYINGTLEGSFTGDTLTTADTTIDTIKWQSPAVVSHQLYFGGVVVDNADTRKLHFDEVTSSAAGTYSEYTGVETDIDNEIWQAALTSSVTFDADSERADFAWTAANSAINSWTVEGVWVGVLAESVATPSLYLQGFARISSTDYDGDDAVQILGAPGDYRKVAFSVDPSTASAWASVAAVNAANLGYQSKTTPTV